MASVRDTHARLALYARRTRHPETVRLVRLLDLIALAVDDPDDFALIANALIRDAGWGDHENPETDPQLGGHT